MVAWLRQAQPLLYTRTTGTNVYIVVAALASATHAWAGNKSL